MSDCGLEYVTNRYELINYDAMCCISVLLFFKSLFFIMKELGAKGLRMPEKV